MKRYPGGSTVPGGYYLDARTFQVTPVQGEAGQLPGPESTRYVRMSLPLLFAAAPVIGAAYVIALPIIGMGMVGYAAARRIGSAAAGRTRALGSTMAPAWRPGEAHFAGKPKDAADPAGTRPATPALDELEKEVERRRGEDAKK